MMADTFFTHKFVFKDDNWSREFKFFLQMTYFKVTGDRMKDFIVVVTIDSLSNLDVVCS